MVWVVVGIWDLKSGGVARVVAGCDCDDCGYDWRSGWQRCYSQLLADLLRYEFPILHTLSCDSKQLVTEKRISWCWIVSFVLMTSSGSLGDRSSVAKWDRKGFLKAFFELLEWIPTEVLLLRDSLSKVPDIRRRPQDCLRGDGLSPFLRQGKVKKVGTNLLRAAVLQHCTLFLADWCSGSVKAGKRNAMSQCLVSLTVVPMLWGCSLSSSLLNDVSKCCCARAILVQIVST
jgi:hypothetical protein